MSIVTQKANSPQSGFSMLELIVAMMVTLVITGSMYGLVTSGSGAFRREPALVDRQQQIRIAMNRIQEDVLNAGLGLGMFIQSFGENLGGLGMLGVRPLADPALGGGNSDWLEVRQQDPDCPQVRSAGLNGANYVAGDTWPGCYPEPGWLLAFFPDGNAKWGWGHNQHGPAGSFFNIPPGQQPVGSQMNSVAGLVCSLDLNATGGVCPPANDGRIPELFAQMERLRYQIANDTDGTPSLFRSDTGGTDRATELFTLPPSPEWQLLARGIEDMQVRYRTFAGWQESASQIRPLDASPHDNVVREVEITLWARAVGAPLLTGMTTAAGNGVTAVRGSLTTTVAPRASQLSLMNDANPAKRWQ